MWTIWRLNFLKILFREAQGVDVPVCFICNGSPVLFGTSAALCSSPQGKNFSCRDMTL